MTVLPEKLARDEGTGRDLFCLRVANADELVPLAGSIGHFVCLLVWDAATESVEQISRVAEHLLESGCVYVCAWGTGCERVHDIFDETIVGDGTQESPDAFHVFTSWHDDEPLDDAIWFFLRSAFPDESVRDSCRSSLAILVGGDDERAAAVRRALTDPVEFSRQVEDAQE
tara:strand:+ start:88 stop:600 length:513 start_codon:yes stop_codon:yes gene_type:complete